MKTFTTMTAVAMLIAGVSFANAQNAAGPAGAGSSPSNLNASVKKGSNAQSGSETKGAAMMKKKDTKDKMNTAQSGTADPSDLNKKPVDSGSAPKSGMQSKGTAMKGAPNTADKMTTGSGSKPADPSALDKKPVDSGSAPTSGKAK